MADTEPLNLFNFIDFLEAQNFTPNTANEARAFIFNNLEFTFGTTYDINELYGAFADVGVTTPFGIFQNIVNLRNEFPGEGNAIQILAPTSPIPNEMMPLLGGNFNNDYFTGYTVTFYDPDIDETITKDFYITYDQQLTPAQLRQAASQDFATRYNVQVMSVELRRSYQTFKTG